MKQSDKIYYEVWQGSSLICSAAMKMTEAQARNKVSNEASHGIVMEARPVNENSHPVFGSLIQNARQEDYNLARLSTRTLHILTGNFDSLCGIHSVQWHRGFIRDERIMCKKCLKKEAV